MKLSQYKSIRRLSNKKMKREVSRRQGEVVSLCLL